MKYLFHVLLLVLAFSMQLHAQEVEADQAKLVAKNFYYAHINQYTAVGYETIEVEELIAVKNDEHDLFFVANMHPDGYILVSATDAVVPVLAYAFSGRFNPSELEHYPNVKIWTDWYKAQIGEVIDQNRVPTPGVLQKWDAYSKTEREAIKIYGADEVEPLVYTTWDQGIFYNGMCPEDPAGPGDRCYAGCVATAMGQVMNYFRWPDTGTASYTYYCPGYDTLSASFGETAYQWDEMELALTGQNNAIAELLYHLGVSVDMQYGPDGSGMYNHKAAFSLRTYFKYLPETEYVYRDSTNLDWDSLLVAHLDRGIPMYYAGWSVPNINGHAFVCDGYQDTSYYHFNWGWSGSYDGYFYTEALSPGGSNFNLAQEVIINAVPDTITYNYPLMCVGEKTLAGSGSVFGDGSGPLFNYEGMHDCSWLIQPEDSVSGILLDLLEFETIAGDTLYVFDGESPEAPLLAALSGSEAPETISGTADHMYISFVSEDNSSAPGWLASYDVQLPVYCSGVTMLTELSDTLTDGSGPYNYHNGTGCIWQIVPEDAESVTLHFEDFKTEEGFDVLKIYDLANNSLLAEFSGDYTGNLPEPVTSPSGKMFIRWTTNASVRDAGWTAWYETGFVGMEEPAQDAFEIRISPNPAGDVVMVSFQHLIFNIQYSIFIYDLFGRKMEEVRVSAEQDGVQFDVSAYPNGVYVAVVKSEDGSFSKKKFVVAR